MIIESLGLGMALGLIYYELLGLSPGGIIVPGYVALLINQPVRVIATLLIGLLTYLLIRGLSQVMILYGRRRFVLAVLFGFLLSRLLETWPILPGTSAELRAIGYVIPGLMANDMENQGILTTAISILAVSALVRLILLVLLERGVII